MKKNKTIAYMLAATLLVGGTFVGTKALFTDQTTVAGELKISTGDLDIEVINSGTWELERNGEEHKDGTTITDSSTIGGTDRLDEDKNGQTNEKVPNGNFANNLKPGDILTKTVTIQNKGTLVATNVTVNTVNKSGLYDGLLKLTSTALDKSVLNPGDTATFELVLEVNDVGGKHGSESINDDQGEPKKEFNTDNQENKIINLDELVGLWQLSATQQNTDFGKDTTQQ